MAGFSLSIIFIILLSILFCAIPAALGIYVYKDAKKRNMNAVLWAVVAVLAPSFIGLIIYLITRQDSPSMYCSVCKSPIQPDYSVCPVCGNQLRHTCTNCGRVLEPGWSTCPTCSTPIPPEFQTAASDKSSGKYSWILIAVAVALPILIIIGIFVCFVSFRISF